MNTSASQRENSLTSKPKVKHQRQNSQENIAVRGDVVGGNQNVPRGQRAHELSDSSGDETEQPARVRFLLYSYNEDNKKSLFKSNTTCNSSKVSNIFFHVQRIS